MQFRRPLPLFFLIVLVVGILISPNPVHGASSIVFKQKADNPNAAITITIGPLTVTSGDALIVNVQWTGIHPASTITVTDSQANTFTLQVSSISTSGSGSDTGIWTTLASTNGGDTITVSNAVFGLLGAFLDYSGVNSFAHIASQQIDNTGTSGTSTITLANINTASWIVENIFYTGTASATGSITSNSGQTLRDSMVAPSCNSQGMGICNSYDIPAPATSFSLSLGYSTGSCGTGCFVSHSALEMIGQFVSSISSVTQCYGACGHPAIKLTNSNATHGVNFNQSFTLFYEFQSGLNGVVFNVTVNVAKNYINGAQIALGLYTASCPAGTTPFTINCAGALQPGFAISNPNVPKGRFTIVTNTPVVTGQWIAIAFTGIYSGLDLNQTNFGCGVAGDDGICAPPMQYTKGTIPQTISTSASCTSANSPCNIAGISTTGLWAWINGNVVINTPLPPPSIGCINADLACFMVASACALTPSNCFIGGAIYLFIYFTIFVVAIAISLTYINSTYEVEFHFPPMLFFLFFLIELFMFTAMGLIPQYVTIVIFIFTALSLAGWFGTQFTGNRGRSD